MCLDQPDFKKRQQFLFASWVLFMAVAAWPALADDEHSTVEVENALLKTIESTKLAAEVAGKIEKLDVVEGTTVKTDQTLGKIRDKAVKLQMERARIALEIAKRKQRSDIDLRLANKRAEVAKSELDRAITANAKIANTYQAKEMERLQLISASANIEIERAEHDRSLMGLDVLTAENEFRQAEHLFERHQIRSPAIGVVVAVKKRVGEWVEPGTELMEIVRIDRLRIEGFINAVAANEPLMGLDANVIVLKGSEERKLPGRVVFISPDANPVNGQVRIFLEVDNSAGEFRPGMRVKAAIPLHSRVNAIEKSNVPQKVDP
jgi:multidrug resistance efflux pump